MVEDILHEQHLDGTVGCARLRDCSLTVAYSLDASGSPWNIRPVSCIISRPLADVHGRAWNGPERFVRPQSQEPYPEL